MRAHRWIGSIAFAATLTLAARGARAQAAPHHGEGEEGEYPVSYVERPLTLPKFVLNPIVGLDITRIAISEGGVSASETSVGMAVGAAFGITDDFEVAATLLPLELSPSPVRYVGPTFAATYRFLSGDVELGGRFSAFIGLGHGDAPGYQVFTPGVPLRAHIGKVARIDTGVFVPIAHTSGTTVELGGLGGTYSTPSTTVVGLSVPVAVAVDIIEPLHVGLNTGFGMSLNPPGTVSVGDTVAIPLGFFGGFAVGDKKPILDIDPFFQFPLFATPGSSGDKIHTNLYTVGLELGGFLYL